MIVCCCRIVRRLLVLCVVALLGVGARAQTDLRALWSVWNEAQRPDTVRLNVLYTIAVDGHLSAEPDPARHFARMQYALAEKNGLPLYMAKALHVEGLALDAQGRENEAQGYYSRSLALFKKAGAKDWMARSYMDLSALHQDLLHYDSSYYYLDKAMVLYGRAGNKEGTARALQRKLYNAKNMADHDKAMEYGLEALRMWGSTGNATGTASAFLDLADIPYYRQNYGESVRYARKAAAIQQELNDE